MKPRTEKSLELHKMLIERGYPDAFCYEVTCNLNTDWTAQRLIGYLHYNPDVSMIDIADEVLAILSDRERIIRKKENEETNMKLNILMREGFGDEEEE